MNRFLFLVLISFFLTACNTSVEFMTIPEDPISLPSEEPKPEPPPPPPPKPKPKPKPKPDPKKTEVFLLSTGEKKAVDFLIVEDSSPSMNHHLSRLGRALSSLLYVISDYDWQIAFTTADHGDHFKTVHKVQNLKQATWQDYDASSPTEFKPLFGLLMPLEKPGGFIDSDNKILTKQTPNYEDVFLLTTSHPSEIDCKSPPYCQGFVEQPLRSLKASIERAHLQNQDLFREKADFVSLIITNEDERTEDRTRATKAHEVIKAFNDQFYHLDKKFIAYNILVKDDKCLREEEIENYAVIGTLISELAHLTGGKNISLCNRNYGEELKDISNHIKESLEKSIVLSEEPIPGTVEITFERENESLSWTRYGRTIIFRGQISQGMEVTVSYKALKTLNGFN